MRAYYYLLYRLYTFYTVTLNRKDQPFMNVSVVSTLLIWFNLIWIYGVLQFYGILPKYSNYTVYAIILTVMWVLNHFIFVKHGRFLQYNFRTDKIGGFIVLLFVGFTITAFIITANENRERVFAEREKANTEIKRVP